MSETKLPEISIVLPTYNGSRFIRKSIESCLSQSFKNFELICIDDCSSDETPKILTEFAARDPRVRVYRNEKNKKLPGSLNRGFELARGKYFSWTSDDNWYAPDALVKLKQVLDTQTDISLVYSDFVIVDEADKSIGNFIASPREKLIEESCVGACFLYRREMQTRLVGYREDLFLSEDYDFWMRASVQFKFAQLHEPLYFYRHHGASLTFSQSARTKVKAASALSQNLAAMSSWLSPRDYVKACLRLAFEFALGKEFRKAAFHLALSFKKSIPLTLLYGLKKALKPLRSLMTSA